MILSGRRIMEEVRKGNIDISDFDQSRLNPNSYNVRLSDEYLTYDNALLDMKKEPPCEKKFMSTGGLILIPGKIYLGRTMEYTKTHGFVPMLEGRSSVGRLGIRVHSTAGFGDDGFEGYWTFEISCIQPVVIYPGVEIAQLYFHTIERAEDENEDNMITYENGKYQRNTGVQTSQMWKEFDK